MTGATFRIASLPEVEVMLDWAAQEGWNPGLHDAEAFHAADPEGFFVAEVQGQPVAAISVVNHSDTFAFLGLYICHPDMRGQGVGHGLWRHALAHAGDRTVGLDGVPEQQSNYRKSGFDLAGQTRRYEGAFATPSPSWLLAKPDDLDAIQTLDRAANGFDRPSFLGAWTEQSTSRKTVVLCSDGAIAGFATARLCREGCKIGPAVAPDATQALHLARQAAAALGQSRVILDLPAQAGAFAERLVSLGFDVSFATARMYKGRRPEQRDTLQAIATMELG